MSVPRKSQRYKVAPTFPLTVFIPQSLSKTYRLRTLGEGGIGFFAPTRDANLVQYPEIDVKLSFGNKSLNLKGTVQYCTFLPRQGANYFGIRFAELDSRQELLVRTIIQAAVKKGDLVDASLMTGT
jgi:hypothetical protein